MKPYLISKPLRMLVALLILCGAFLVLYRELASVSYTVLISAIQETSAVRLLCSLLATVISFASLAIYDIYSVKIVAPDRISLRRAAFAGAAGNAISNTLGFHALTGSAVRARLYVDAGITTGDVARIISLAGAGVGMSFVCLVVMALLGSPSSLNGWAFLVGLVMIIILAMMLYWLSRKKRSVILGQWSLPFPDANTATKLMIIGIVEMSAAVAALYILLPTSLAPNFFNFTLIYIGAIFMGIASLTPGGIGVFEAAILAASPGLARPAVLAALVLYRLIYNILPFCIAVSALAIFERNQMRKSV